MAERIRNRCVLAGAVIAALAPLVAQPPKPPVKPAPPAKLAAKFAKLPLAFEPGPHGDFLARGPGYVLRLRAGEADLALASGGKVRLSLAGARAAAGRAAHKLASVTNEYFGKDPQRWRTGVPNYGEVRYANVYPGVSVRYYGHQGELESDFVLAPGADAGRIRLKLSRPARLRDGALEIRADGKASVRLGRPEIYQLVGGRRRAVAGGYEVRQGEVRFLVGAYDHKLPLVIDPTLTYSYLATGGYSTVLGGNVIPSGLMSQQMGFGVESNGDTVLVGLTNAANFPVTNSSMCGQLNTTTGNCYAQDIFITEFNASGTGLVFSTYFGSQAGTANMADAAATLDASGNIYVAGQTNATDLPVTGGVVQASASNNYLAKFNAAGGLGYSTYLGGSGMQIFAVAADSAGDAYVAGQDDSYYNDVPETNPLPNLCSGSCETGFVLEVNSTATQYLYGTLLTTSDNSSSAIYALAVDGAGHIYLGGQTGSMKLPAVQAIQPTCPTAAAGATYCESAGFLMELNPQLSGSSQIAFSTYLGGTAPFTTSKITSLALDGASPPNLYAAGFLNGTGLPVTAQAFGQQLGYGIDPTSAQNVYLAKIPTGTPSQPAYITYLGGTGSDTPEAIAADANGDAWIAGITESSDYPVTAPILAACPDNDINNCNNGFVSELDPTGSNLLFSTYIGGNANPSDFVTGIGFDSSGNVYIGGLTSAPNFPTTAGAYQSACFETNGACEQFAAFAAKLAAAPAPAAPTVQFSVNGQPLGAGGYSFGNGFENFTNSVVITATNASTTASLQIAKVYGHGPNNDFGAISVAGSNPGCNLGPVAPGGSCDFTATWYAYQAGPGTGAIEVSDNANGGPPSPQIIPLSGNAINDAQATVTSTGTNFGDVLQGQTATEIVTITSSGNQPLTISSIGLAGSSDFTLGTAPANPCPLTGTTLGAARGSSDTSHYCEVEVSYSAKGTFNVPESATLSVTDNSLVTAPATATQTLNFQATTMQPEPQIEVNTGQTGSALDFPVIGLGSPSSTLDLQILNDGPATLQITQDSVIGANAGDFHIASDTCANAGIGEFGTCNIGIYFEPTLTPAGAETASLQITSNNPVNPFLVPLNGTGGTPPGPPASWPFLVSLDNEVPPQPALNGVTTSAVSGNGQFVAFTGSAYSYGTGNLPGPSNGTGAGLYLRNTCNGAASNCAQSTQYIAYGPASGPFANGGAACDNQQTTITLGATNPQISDDGRFVAFNDDACPLDNTTGSQPEPGPVYLRDTQANGGAGATTAVRDANGNPLMAVFAMSEDARFFAWLTNPTSGGQPEITATDTCQSDGTVVCATRQDALVSQSNNGTPDSSASYLLTAPAPSPDGRYVAFASDWDDVNGVAGNGHSQVYLRDTCLGVAAGCTPGTILVSQDASGAPGTGGNSGQPYNIDGQTIGGIAVSSGGRYVVFTSNATNLPQPANGNGTYPQEVYLRDTVAGTTTLLSAAIDGSTPGGNALQPHISDDGRIVTFVDAAALYAGAPGNGYQGAVYSYDTCTSNGTPVSGCTAGLQAVVSEQALAAGGTEDVTVSDSELAGGGAAVTYTGPPYNCTNCTQVWLNELSAASPIPQGTVVTLKSLTPSTTTPAASQQYSYTLTAANDGALSATDVTLSDSLPAGAAFVGATGGTCTAAGGVVNCDLGPMSAGASATVTITLDAPNTPGAALTDVASVATGTQFNAAVQTSLSNTITETAPPPPPSIVTTSLPPGVAGEAYPSTLISTSGGTGTVTVSQSSGSLPPGLGLSANTLAGVPTLSGSYSFSLVATDANNTTSSPQSYTVGIACPAISLGALYAVQVGGQGPSPVPSTLDLTAGALIPVVQFVATLPLGDNLPLTFSESGPLDGLTFNPATAQLSGTPLGTGSFTFSVSVAGGGCTSVPANYTLVVSPPLAITLPTINETITASDSIGSPNTLISATVLPAIQESVHASDAIASPNTLISAEVLQPIQETVTTSDSLGSPNTLISAVVLPAVQENVLTSDALTPAPAIAVVSIVQSAAAAISRDPATGVYTVVLTVANHGNIAASLQVTGATLGAAPYNAAAAGTVTSLSSLAPGATGAFTLVFPASAGAPSLATVLRVGGSYTAATGQPSGNWSAASRVLLP